jgi:hypothetical protein
MVAGTFTLFQDDAVARCDVKAVGCESADWLFINPAQSRDDRRAEFFHEMGHKFDAEMPDWKRTAFMRIARRNAPWSSDADYPPEEEFADAYSECARHNHWSNFSTLDYASQFRRTCKLIKA